MRKLTFLFLGPFLFLLPAACGDDGSGGGIDTDGASGGSSGNTASSSGTDGTTGNTGNSGASNSGSASGGTATGDSAGTDTGGCAAIPTFEKDIIPIFEVRCGTMDGACHFRNAYGAQADADCRGWLSLENAPLGAEFYDGPNEGQPTGCPNMTLYERLTGLDAWNCEKYDERRRYVVPCDPEGSYVFNKIGGGPLCGIDKDGQNNVPSWPMPPPKDEMPNGYSISQGDIDIIYAWIAAGAPRDGQECDALCGGGTTGGSTGGGTVGTDTGNGATPEVQINHPGNGEMRQVNMNIPLIGVATDAEDGELTGNALVWSSDLEGDVAMGAQGDWVPTMLGVHTLTLTATDSDANEGSDSVQIEVIP